MSKSMLKVKYIGKDDPLALRQGKVYDAIVGQKGAYCVVDETGEEYAYPPALSEIVEDENNISKTGDYADRSTLVVGA